MKSIDKKFLSMYKNKMKKKILFASIFVLILILFMPSIPAIQQKTIENRSYRDFVGELKNSNLDDNIKLPTIYGFVLLILYFRWIRMDILREISIDSFGFYINIKHPILALRGMWLYFRMDVWLEFWTFISVMFDLNWEFSIPKQN